MRQPAAPGVRRREAFGGSPCEVRAESAYHHGCTRNRPATRGGRTTPGRTVAYRGGVNADQPSEPGWRGGPPGRGGPPWRGAPPWARTGPRRRSTRHPGIFSAVLVFLIEFAGVHWAQVHQPDRRPLDGWGVALLALGCAALIWRRYARVPMLAITVATTAAYVLFGYPYGPIFLACLVATLGAVRTGHRYGTWITLGAGYLVVLVAGRFWPTLFGVPLRTPTVSTSILVAAWIIVACVIGEAIRVRSERFAEVARVHAEQARARAEQERRQASEERLRIAQELHDVLGHHLSLINVQAGVGLHLMDDDPQQARRALETIKQASAEALGEVRGVLGLMRARDERAPRSPAPSLANLDTLVDGAHATITGTPRPLPPEVDRAAFRIVQESLTNVRRHAGDGAIARVTIAYEPDRLTVTVADDGAGPAPAGIGAGNGIAGMRTRAEELGGTFRAGSGPGTGFLVTASLPAPAETSDGTGTLDRTKSPDGVESP
jgi:signal transduction histidine kinase